MHACTDLLLTSDSARDRVNLLLDSDSPFLELCALAGHDQETSSASASLVAGIGNVWYASNSTWSVLLGENKD